MTIMLPDDPVIVVFESPDDPPSWIEGCDIAGGYYQFCDEHGQRYVGVITKPSRWGSMPEFVLRPEGAPELANVLALVDRAELLAPNNRFHDLEALRTHLVGHSTE